MRQQWSLDLPVPPSSGSPRDQALLRLGLALRWLTARGWPVRGAGALRLHDPPTPGNRPETAPRAPIDPAPRQRPRRTAAQVNLAARSRYPCRLLGGQSVPWVPDRIRVARPPIARGRPLRRYPATAGPMGSPSETAPRFGPRPARPRRACRRREPAMGWPAMEPPRHRERRPQARRQRWAPSILRPVTVRAVGDWSRPSPRLVARHPPAHRLATRQTATRQRGRCRRAASEHSRSPAAAPRDRPPSPRRSRRRTAARPLLSVPLLQVGVTAVRLLFGALWRIWLASGFASRSCLAASVMPSTGARRTAARARLAERR
jgi:hypothetical protein